MIRFLIPYPAHQGGENSLGQANMDLTNIGPGYIGHSGRRTRITGMPWCGQNCGGRA